MIPMDSIKIIVPAAATFIVGVAITPLITHYLYAYKAWKKRPGKTALDGSVATEFNKLHTENEARAPRMGGIVVWASVLITVISLAFISWISAHPVLQKLSFLSRGQTWIPLGALLIGAISGLVDDILVIRPNGKGLPLSVRLGIVVALSAAAGWWFYEKLGVTAITMPFGNVWELDWLIIPVFIAIALAVYASGTIDGIDGLSGGVFASVFASYAIIAFEQSQLDVAAFCASVVGGLLAFLWFNVPPARFYMTETGTMALTLALSTVAFMTDQTGGGLGITALPIIGALLAATVASNIIQVFSKKLRGKKVFRVAPLHHHFEALGWPGYKVTMRYWIISVVLAFVGVIYALTMR